VKRTTTLDVSPERIHEIGIQGIERLNRELDAVRAKVGFSGTLAEFRQFLKTDTRFFAKTPDEVGERLMAAQNRILRRSPISSDKRRAGVRSTFYALSWLQSVCRGRVGLSV
jgi:uncharacterized protein (DUF885 family)